MFLSSSLSIVSFCLAFEATRSDADSLGNPAGDFALGLAAGTTVTRCCCTMRQSLPTVSSLRLVTCVRPLASLQLQIVSTCARHRPGKDQAERHGKQCNEPRHKKANA